MNELAIEIPVFDAARLLEPQLLAGTGAATADLGRFGFLKKSLGTCVLRARNWQTANALVSARWRHSVCRTRAWNGW
jgi:hypothetical protein